MNIAEVAQPLVAAKAKRSLPRQLGRFMWRYPLGGFGAVILLVMVLMAVFAGPVSPYDPLKQHIPNQLEAPSLTFWLGTDIFGRDVFSRIVFGARTSLYVGLISVGLATVVGTIFGVTSAYLGGKFDLLLQRVVDAFMGFPGFVLALMMVVGLGASLNNVTLAIAISTTPRFVRLARAAAFSVEEEVYVLAAQAIGASGPRVVLRHILPNTLAPIFVLATSSLGTAIVAEAGLSFLGLGVPPPHPSWGGMLQIGAKGYMEAAPWLAIFPGVALSFAIFSFAFLGDALRDAFDPRLRSR